MENKIMPGLKALTLQDIQLLNDYLTRFPREYCDYNITNLLVWEFIYQIHYLIYKGRLVLYFLKPNVLFFPMGEELSPQELRELVELFGEYFPTPKMILIPPEYVDRHSDLEDYFVIEGDRDSEDYIYETQSMVDLRGKKLAKKKNLVSQFVRVYPQYKVLQISEEHVDVILSFTKKWRYERSAEDSYLDTEYEVIENTMRHWTQLPVEGIIICLDERIAAFSIFSQQTADMVTVHFEKFDPNKKGSGQLINWETARYLLPRYKWINREQDIGLAGLRQAKLSYVPARLLQFFELHLRAEKSLAKAE